MNKLSNNNIFLICIITLAGILSFSLYLPSLKTPFLFDDLLIINPSVDYSGGIKALLESIDIFSSRPLLGTTYRLNSLISRGNPAGYHIVNIALHFLNSLLLFFIVRMLLLKTSDISELLQINILSFASVLFFLVHPLASESVIYITGRSSLLYTFFLLLSFLSFLKAIEAKSIKLFLHITVSLLFFFCALLSKEISLIFPAFILIATLFFYRDENKERTILLFLPYFLISLFVSLLKMPSLFILKSPDKTVRPLFTHILTEFNVFAHYLLKMLYPVNLNIDPFFSDIGSLFNVHFLLGFLIFTLLIFIAYRIKKNLPLSSFGIIWLILAFSPHLLVRLRDYMCERWLYFPLIALAFLISDPLKRLISKKEQMKKKYIAAAILCLSTCFYLGLTGNRIMDWKSDISIWKDAVKKSPQKFRTHANLGYVLLKKERYEEAKEEIKKAIEINNKYAEIHYYLAEAYLGLGNDDMALKEFEESLKYLPYYDYNDNPTYYNSLINMGVIFFKKGDKQKALESFNAAIRQNPKRPQAYNNIGILYLSTGELKKAEQFFIAALFRDNDNKKAKENLRYIYALKEKEAKE
ncbi:MAG: tetratricopeptide repeat protein [Candidatus Schekmanbacteria bacterium]|nr:MAG: tetratricopeptide repeat protein [Candidatus Schekmanbacteria bacterium]